MSKAAVGVLSAVVLSVSLFTQPVPASAGWYTVLNNPLFILLLLGVMVGISLLFPELVTARPLQSGAHAARAQISSNRSFNFSGTSGTPAFPHNGRPHV